MKIAYRFCLLILVIAFAGAGCQNIPDSTILPSIIEATVTSTVSVTLSVVLSTTPTATLVESQLTLTPPPPATEAIDGNLRLIRTFNQADDHFDFSPDSRFIAISRAEAVGIYDALSEELKVEFEKPPSDSFSGPVVFSSEGSWLAARVSMDGPNNIYVWNLRNDRLVKQFEFPRFVDLKFSYDGQLLAVANQLGAGGLIVIWNLKTGARRDLEAFPYEIAFSP